MHRRVNEWLVPISAYSGVLKFDMKIFVNVGKIRNRLEVGASVYFGHISSFFCNFWLLEKDQKCLLGLINSTRKHTNNEVQNI